MDSPTVTWPQLKDFLQGFGIDTEGIRDVLFEVGRVTVTRRVAFPAGMVPVNQDSIWEIETYPMVREGA